MYYCIVFGKGEEPLHAYSFDLLPTRYTATISYEAFKSATRKCANFRYALYDEFDFSHWQNFHIRAGCEKLNIVELDSIWTLYRKIAYDYKLKKFNSSNKINSGL